MLSLQCFDYINAADKKSSAKGVKLNYILYQSRESLNQ